jgi:hypothetical protein
MAIQFEKFLEWAESRFTDVIVKGNEIKLNSIFCDDQKHHLWCNPYGGKKNNENGVFHCWKSNNKGSLVSLVMQVDNCSYEEALEILDCPNTNLASLEKKVNEIFENKKESFLDIENTNIQLPHGCYSFDDLPSGNYHRTLADVYLDSRKIPRDNLLICTEGKYKSRIIIPYYNKNRDLIYFNSRLIGNGDSYMRYMGPPKEVGIGKGDVLYFPKWPESKVLLHLTEGEFDTLSLHSCGIHAAAFGGKNLSDSQVEIIRPYIPVLCLDGDKYGVEALINMGNLLLKKGFKEIYYVRIPNPYKDWNEFLIDTNQKILNFYIKNNIKKYDVFDSIKIKNSQIN